MNDKEKIELLLKEFERMEGFAQTLLMYYCTSLNIMLVAGAALIYWLIKESKTADELLASNSKGPRSLMARSLPLLGVLLIGAWAALWLYLNKELWMARQYLGDLERALHKALPGLLGHTYYSEFMFSPKNLYSKESPYSILLNSLVAAFPIFVLFLLAMLDLRVCPPRKNRPSTWVRSALFYILVMGIVGIVFYVWKSIPL